MDVNVGESYFDDKENYKDFLSYRNNVDIEKQIESKIVGSVTGDGIEIKEVNQDFVFEVEYALYSKISDIKIEDILDILQTSPEQYKKCNCYKKQGVCEIWLNSKKGVLEGFYTLLPDSRKAIVKNRHREYLDKYIKNLDDIIFNMTANDLFHEIASLVHKDGMEWGRYKKNYFGLMLGKEYSEVYKDTLEYEASARLYVEEANDMMLRMMDFVVDADVFLDSIIEMQILSFDEQVSEKMEIKGLSREDAIWEINERWRGGV